MTFDEIADRTIAWAVDAQPVRALWIEGDVLAELRRPYRRLRFHLAADEPDYPALLAALLAGPSWLPGAVVRQSIETRRFARELTIDAGGVSFTLIAEQSYLLAKRPRAEVVPLVDKTGHLTHVLDFSLRGRAPAP